MLATEPTTTSPLLERWEDNERMRHVPSVEWLVSKLDGDIRRRIDKLHASFAALPHDHPHHAAIEQAFRGYCKSLDCLAEAAKHSRNGSHGPQEVGARIGWSMNHALSCLRSLDATTFGRRYPFHHFERSKSEPVTTSFMAVLRHVEKVAEQVRLADPSIDERLLEGLVVLSNPVDERMLRPIA